MDSAMRRKRKRGPRKSKAEERAKALRSISDSKGSNGQTTVSRTAVAAATDLVPNQNLVKNVKTRLEKKRERLKEMKLRKAKAKTVAPWSHLVAPSSQSGQHGETVTTNSSTLSDPDSLSTVSSISVPPTCRVIEQKQGEEYVLVIEHCQEVCFHGKALVSCLHGSVFIYGCTLHQGQEPLPVYAPRTHSALYITPLPHQGRVVVSEHVKQLLGEDVKEDTVVVLVQKLKCPMVDYVTSVKEYANVFYWENKSKDSVIDRVMTPDHSKLLESVGVHVVDDPATPRLFTPEPVRAALADVLEQVEQAVTKGTTAPVILLCGGKNSGKSTLARFLINLILSSCGEVYHLECDIGQTEFTPSGFVSLTHVTTPTLGPPFTHQKTPDRCCYYGHLSPNDDPDRYIRTVKYVHQGYRGDAPLIVNTMGWTQGLGLHLLMDTLHLVRPSHILQLKGRKSAQDLPQLSHQFLHTQPGWAYANIQVETDKEDDADDDDAVPVNPELVYLQVGNDMPRHTWFTASEFRSMALMAALSALQPDCPVHPLNTSGVLPLNALTPRVVPWSSVAVHVCNADVPPSQVMYVLNASVVALCQAGDSEFSRLRQGALPDGPVVLQDTPICQAVGIGIIRGIDMERRVFYVLTSVEEHRLTRVNMLMCGALSIPAPLMLQQNVEGPVPYVTSEFSPDGGIFGATPLRIRKNLQRERRQTAGTPGLGFVSPNQQELT
ncbi:PREDICTED: polynucleotide 5'-hydroxyl-kinase NOL9-like [Branchiostoma belcheri]|uniref:Polynucleotide 5'-hydroxyl-kinase NOL9 n=1 Tax=Branchiostoma belcheri TaxID=7741 RepID=A0A6P5AYV4_BRABE|nr:PREDICTED: polynucleotide 5'-hydroxyl-kinase NOL9-like [Branchiostoma belcheri]